MKSIFRTLTLFGLNAILILATILASTFPTTVTYAASPASNAMTALTLPDIYLKVGSDPVSLNNMNIVNRWLETNFPKGLNPTDQAVLEVALYEKMLDKMTQGKISWQTIETSFKKPINVEKLKQLDNSYFRKILADGTLRMKSDSGFRETVEKHLHSRSGCNINGKEYPWWQCVIIVVVVIVIIIVASPDPRI